MSMSPSILSLLSFQIPSALPPIPRHILLLLLGAVLVAFFRWITRPDPLSDVPGPWLARWTTLLLAYHARTGKRHLYVDWLHKKYGPLVRLTPTQISCATPSALSTIYAHGPSALPKSPFYRAFYVSGTPNLFSTQDRAGHARKRRALAHAFSAMSVRGYELWVRECLGGLVKGLDARCVGELEKGLGIGAQTMGRAGGSEYTGVEQDTTASATPTAADPTDSPFTDILAWLNYMTFDVISSLAFGKALGMLEGEGDLGDTDIDVDDVIDSEFQPEAVPSNTAQLTPSLRTSKQDAKPTPIHTLIDYRGRTAAFLGLFPAWHAILHPLLHRYARWVPDEFIRRGVSGTETLSYVARRCVRQRLLPSSTSQVIPRSASLPETNPISSSYSSYLPYVNSNSLVPDSDPESLSDIITTTPSTLSDSESDSDRAQNHITNSNRPPGAGVDLKNVAPHFDVESRRQPDLLDRIIDGMRRAKTREIVERRERERGEIHGIDFWEGHESGERGYEDEDVREEDVVTEAMLLLTAGSDTTANSTAAVLFYIIRTPHVHLRLREELEAAVNCNPMEGDVEGLVWYDQIKSLKYLQATIDEGLRMFATNAFGLPRVVPPGGAVYVEGRVFGEDTELSVPAYTIQRDPAIWGDPEVFRPERWLEEPGTNNNKHSDAAEKNFKGWSGNGRPKGAELKKYLLTFGMGPRACIGKNLATMQMQLLIAMLVLRYDMELRNEVLESVEGFMHKPVAVWVRLRRKMTTGKK